MGVACCKDTSISSAGQMATSDKGRSVVCIDAFPILEDSSSALDQPFAPLLETGNTTCHSPSLSTMGNCGGRDKAPDGVEPKLRGGLTQKLVDETTLTKTCCSKTKDKPKITFARVPEWSLYVVAFGILLQFFALMYLMLGPCKGSFAPGTIEALFLDVGLFNLIYLAHHCKAVKELEACANAGLQNNERVSELKRNKVDTWPHDGSCRCSWLNLFEVILFIHDMGLKWIWCFFAFFTLALGPLWVHYGAQDHKCNYILRADPAPLAMLVFWPSYGVVMYIFAVSLASSVVLSHYAIDATRNEIVKDIAKLKWLDAVADVQDFARRIHKYWKRAMYPWLAAEMYILLEVARIGLHYIQDPHLRIDWIVDIVVFLFIGALGLLPLASLSNRCSSQTTPHSLVGTFRTSFKKDMESQDFIIYEHALTEIQRDRMGVKFYCILVDFNFVGKLFAFMISHVTVIFGMLRLVVKRTTLSS